MDVAASILRDEGDYIISTRREPLYGNVCNHSREITATRERCWNTPHICQISDRIWCTECDRSWAFYEAFVFYADPERQDIRKHPRDMFRYWPWPEYPEWPQARLHGGRPTMAAPPAYTLRPRNKGGRFHSPTERRTPEQQILGEDRATS